MEHTTMKGIAFIVMIAVLSLAAAGADISVSVQINTTGHGGDDCFVEAELLYPNGTLINYQSGTSTPVTPTLGVTVLSFSEVVDDDEDYIIRTRASANAGIGTQALPMNTTTHTPFAMTPTPHSVTIRRNMEYVVSLIAPANNSIQPNSTTFTWDFTYDTGETNLHRLIIDDNPDFSSPILNATYTQANHTLTASEALSDDTYYWKVEIHDPYNTPTRVTESRVRTFQVNEGSVTLSNFTPTTQWFNTTQTIQFDSSLAAECRYATTNNTNFDAKTPLDTTGGTTHSATIPFYQEGANTFYFQCNNSINGISGNDKTHVLNYDSIPPSSQSATVTIENGSNYATSTTLDFTWSGFSDASSTITTYYYNTTNNQQTTSGIRDTGSPGQMSILTQGNVSIHVWPQDQAGNIGNASTGWIIIDTLPPDIISTSWTNLNRYSTDDMEIRMTLQDTSPLLNNAPSIRYTLGNSTWQGPFDMNPGAGSIETGQDFTFNITPPNEWEEYVNQSVNFTITSEDIHGWTEIRSFAEVITFTVTPPVLDPIPDITIDQREELRLNITASDVDNDQLTFFSNISGMSINKINNTLATLVWVPGPQVMGTVNARITVSDQVHNVSRDVVFEVININDPPIFNTEQSTYEAYNYEQFNLSINATDYDNDQIFFDTNSTVFQISENGLIRAYPSAEHRGTHRINVTITDEFGLSAWKEIIITVNYCGDEVCNTIESCSTCTTDCGLCDDTESSAIIIYPRNCLEDTMTIKAVRLVPRATCETQGLIIDSMEVCGVLANKEIIVEHIINDTYEEVMSLMTDSEGLVTFTPKEKGQYRLTLQGEDAQEEFHTKECITEEEETTEEPTLPKQEDEPIDTSVEQPTQIKKESESRIWPFLLILVLIAVIGVVGGHYGYIHEVRRVQAGSIKHSTYVTLIDKVLTYGYLLRTEITKRAKQNEFLYYLSDAIKERYDIGKQRLKEYMNKLIAFADPILKRLKSKHIKVPFIKVTNITYEKSLLLTLLSAHMTIHKWLKKKILLEKLRNIPATKNNSLVRMAYTSTNLNNTIQIIDNIKYTKNHHDIALLKETLRRGAHYEKRNMTIEDLKKEMKKGIVIAQILAQDPKQENRYTRNNVVVTGYDEGSIFYHDYLNNIKNRKVKKILFYTAWKNAGFRMIRLSR
ncbi:MAG: Ig-like domain-containing protein [Nanobdellota archaeon]